MRPLVEEELAKLVSQGVIEPVTYSDWAAPIVPVLKADKKSVRICGDFSTTVNKASRLDNYPIPKVEDLFAKLQGGAVFTKLDMSQAYQQLSLDEESKQYVVVNTHKGLYRFNRLPFGVSSAPGIFQRAMESLLQDIPSVVVYIDDILITGATEAEHLQTLSKVLERLESAGLTLKKEKCVFASTSVTYLGHTIDRDGIHPTPDKVQAVQQAPTPKNVTELKAFLGLLNYYGKFMPNLATTLKPLYNLLQESTKWRWNDKEKKAFEASKKLLLSSQVLTHYNPELQLVLACDASQYGLLCCHNGIQMEKRDQLDMPQGHCPRLNRIILRLKKRDWHVFSASKDFTAIFLEDHLSSVRITSHSPLCSQKTRQFQLKHLPEFNDGR